MIELDERTSNDPETQEVLKLIANKERELTQREKRVQRDNFGDESSLFSRRSELESRPRSDTLKRPTLLGGPPAQCIEDNEQFEMNNSYNKVDLGRELKNEFREENSVFGWNSNLNRNEQRRNEMDFGVGGGRDVGGEVGRRAGGGERKGGRERRSSGEVRKKGGEIIRPRGDMSGGKHDVDIREFDWRGLRAEEFDHIPPRFLFCHDCNVKLDNGQSYVNHMGGKKHMTVLMEIQVKANELKHEMRKQIGKYESHRLKVASGKEEKNRCNLCETMVVGPIAHHRSKAHHKALKLFVHPFCPVCTIELNNREDWEFHRFSSKHLMLVSQENRTGKLTLAKDDDFYKELASLKKLNAERETETKKGRDKDSSRDRKRETSRSQKRSDDGKREEKKRDEKKRDDKAVGNKKGEKKAECNNLKDVKGKIEDDDDIQEITFVKKDDKTPTIIKEDEKTSLLKNLEIGDYESFDEKKVVGTDFLRPVSGFFCRVCKKLLLTPEESVTHMKTKPHWDLCVKASKAAKAKASTKRKAAAVPATGSNEPLGKIAKN